MKLLFLTQVLDRADGVLGFVPRWVEGLAREAEAVRVVALEVGDASALPANVDAREIGRKGVVGRYLRYRRVLAEAFAEGFDAVLAHMVPRYALVAARPARRAGARLYLWYTHKGVDDRLRRAERLVEKVFTASPESLRLETEKRVVTGHGIDLEHFAATPPTEGSPRLLSVGRLTPAKDPQTLVAALSILASRGIEADLDLVGGTLAAGDPAYVRALQETIELGALSDRVHMHGSVSYQDVPRWYRDARVVLNPSFTGSVDKVVLEAMATGRAVLTCNESFARVLAPLGKRAAWLQFEKGNASELADKLEHLLSVGTPGLADLGRELREIVARDHEVDALMRRLVAEMGGA